MMPTDLIIKALGRVSEALSSRAETTRTQQIVHSAGQVTVMSTCLCLRICALHLRLTTALDRSHRARCCTGSYQQRDDAEVVRQLVLSAPSFGKESRLLWKKSWHAWTNKRATCISTALDGISPRKQPFHQAKLSAIFSTASPRHAH